MGNIDSVFVDSGVLSQPAPVCGASSASQPFRPASREAAEDCIRNHLSQRGFSAAALAPWAASLPSEGSTSLLQNLATELRAGLCRLESDEGGTLARCISVVELSVTVPLPTGDAVLLEEEQIFGNGHRRPRRHRPHAKLRDGEAPLAGARRALQQRLDLDSEVIDRLFPSGGSDEVSRAEDRGNNGHADMHQAVSSTFPYLHTRYTVHRVQLPLAMDAKVPQLGLPAGEPFATMEVMPLSASSDGSASSASSWESRCIHLWRWVPSDFAFGFGLIDSSGEAASKEQSADQDCASTTLEETYKDLQAVIRLLEGQKAMFAQQGRLGFGPAGELVEGMQEKLRHVMTRISNVEDLVHQVNIESVMSSRSPGRSKSRSGMGKDLRDFISNNFMEHTLVEARDTRARSKTMVVPKLQSRATRSAGRSRHYTTGATSKCGASARAISEPPTPTSPSRNDQFSSSSSSGDDDSCDGVHAKSMDKSMSMPARSARVCVKKGKPSPDRLLAKDGDRLEDPLMQLLREQRAGSSSSGDRSRGCTQDSTEEAQEGTLSSSVRFGSCHFERRDCGQREDLDSVTWYHGATNPWEASVPAEVEALQACGGDRSWVLDCLTLSEKTNAGSLLVSAELFVMPQVPDFGTSEVVMRRFLSALHGRYLQNLNPFHSEAHVALVTHATRWLGNGGRGWHVAPVVERVATDIAALAHDAGHFSRNNAFCINTGHWLALTYNDRSVLENMHAATCFQLMNHHDRDILRPLSKENKRCFRDHVVDLILATDMASHFEFLGLFRVSLCSDNFDPEGSKHRALLNKCCLKAADLGHTALPWELHEPWVLRLLAEFFDQGDEERSMGLQVSPMCSHSQDMCEFKEGQKGFLQFVVMPLYKELTVVLEGCDVAGTCITRIEQNGKHWVEGELSPELIALVTGTSQGDVSPEAALAKCSHVQCPPASVEKQNEAAMETIEKPAESRRLKG